MTEQESTERPAPDDPLAANEPLFDPQDTPPRGLLRSARADTPAHGIRTVAPKTNPSLRMIKRGRGWINGLMLVAALLITIVAALLYSQGSTPVPAPTQVVQATRVPPTAPSTVGPATSTPVPPTPAPVTSLTSTDVPPELVADLLRHPGDTVAPADAIFRMQNAFTIAPASVRSGVVTYTIQPGDDLTKIADRFGLTKETLIWNNDGIYVNRLLPGDTLNILPEDGVLHKTAGDETIQAIADKYKVSPYVIIDSEYNLLLRNAKPTTLLPAGITVMVPGGTSTKQAVYWNPGIQFQGASSSGSDGSSGGSVSFGGGPGSCGAQPNGGGTGRLVVPLPPVYTVARGFSPTHSGIDLDAPAGTTVFAADGGTVIFAGWSNWGYGYSIVIAHGRLMTLYGHLSRIGVDCGQTVSQGTPIGAVGSSGNSTGPHLHFEVRVGETPDNPENYLTF
jgi:murein DD-endopeptidase MepM/ murein hydrolase activator NlpD